jgi:hypothetical protein
VTNGQTIKKVMRNGRKIPFKMVTIKGIEYATFSAVDGKYGVRYARKKAAPMLSKITFRRSGE